MSGGGSKTTSTTTTGASKSIQALSDANAAAASKLAPTQIYQGQRVADQSAATQGGLSGLTALANGNMGGAGLSGQYQSIINNGGFNASQMDALNNTRAVANGTFDLNSDPGWAQVRDAAVGSVNLNAAGMGRSGSGVNQNVLGSTVGDLAARQYQNFLTRKDAANNSLYNMGQGGIANLGTAYTGMQAPGQTLLGVGQQQDAFNQAGINANIDKFNETQSAPRSDIAWLNGILSGAGQLNQTSTSKTPGQSGLMNALGYGLSGAGLLGGFF